MEPGPSPENTAFAHPYSIVRAVETDRGSWGWAKMLDGRNLSFHAGLLGVLRGLLAGLREARAEKLPTPVPEASTCQEGV